jgi:type VI secretion system protein ImpH
MEAGSGSGRADLAAALVESAHDYDFFQAMWLLERSDPGGAALGEGEPLSRERLRLRSDPSLSFPSTDIARAEASERDPERLVLWLHFMGLTGVSSPLPNYFVEPIAKQADGGAALADFMAMFEHRMYSFFWRAWKKYRLDLFATSTRRSGLGLLLNLAGITAPAVRERMHLDPLRVTSFAGLLGTRHRTASGLCRLVSGYFHGLAVRVAQNTARRVWIRERRPLGGDRPARLGANTLLGETVRDSSALLRLHLGPLDLSTYITFLPGADSGSALAELVALYLPAGLDFQVVLRLRHDEIPPLQLGSPAAQLGRLTWIGRPVGDGESGPVPAAAFAAAA